MLRTIGKTIIMDEGDYGLDLPFKLSGKNILANDTIAFKIGYGLYSDKCIVKKEFNNLVEKDGKFVFVLNFDKNETELLKSGEYVYGLKQYRDGEFLNTIINCEKFIVNKGV